ncbi:hypothetical protein [Kitasatospora sp. NPDC001095]
MRELLAGAARAALGAGRRLESVERLAGGSKKGVYRLFPGRRPGPRRAGLRIDLDMEGKTLTLITRPGIVVDSDGLALEFSRVRNRRAPDSGVPTTLRGELVGTKRHGRVVVR